jgi:hypothetical protein
LRRRWRRLGRLLQWYRIRGGRNIGKRIVETTRRHIEDAMPAFGRVGEHP